METLATLMETLMETFYGVTGARPRWNFAELVSKLLLSFPFQMTDAAWAGYDDIPGQVQKEAVLHDAGS